MGSATEIYVDPSINANSGTGTIGDPYGDLQYALDSTTQGTDGDRFNIKAGTAEVLTAAIDLTTYGSPSWNTPLQFQGYTSAAGDGGQGEISGGGTVQIYNTTTSSYTFFTDLKLGNTGTNAILSMTNNVYGHFLRCEFHTTSNVNMVVTTSGHKFFTNCYFHTWTYAGADGRPILMDGTLYAIGNYIDTGTVDVNYVFKAYETRHNVVHNIIKMNHVNAVGIQVDRRGYVYGNSIYNGAAGTEGGIQHLGNNTGPTSIISNLIEGFSGTGGAAIDETSVNKGFANYLLGNYYYNCTAAQNKLGDDFIENEITLLTASPFADAANGDFTPSAEIKDLGYPSSYGNGLTTSYRYPGAIQASGATKVSYTSVY